jgi:hypothetical protein
MNNKKNITQKKVYISKNIKEKPKLKEKYNQFYNYFLNNNEFKFEKNNTSWIIIKNPKKTLVNRFKDLYNLINNL